MTVCKKCGSDEVQSKQWVGCNTGEIFDLADSQGEDAQDNWCPDCDDHCDLIDKDIYDSHDKNKR